MLFFSPCVQYVCVESTPDLKQPIAEKFTAFAFPRVVLTTKRSKQLSKAQFERIMHSVKNSFSLR